MTRSTQFKVSDYFFYVEFFWTCCNLMCVLLRRHKRHDAMTVVVSTAMLYHIASIFTILQAGEHATARSTVVA